MTGDSVYCENCGCYLGEAPLMLHDEYGRPTYQVAFCPHCGTELSVDDENNVKTKQIDTWFDWCWKLYPRHNSKVTARKAFECKLPRDYDSAYKKAQKIYLTIKKQINIWEQMGKEEEYIPYFSSWLNSNFETVKKTTKRRKK